MVPAAIPLLLLMIPSMLTTLSVVREKEMGSIVNLYVTPVSRVEYMIGKQLPYIGMGMVNYVLLLALSVTAFGVPVKGSLFTLTLGALLYLLFSTGVGLFTSAFTRSQIAAMFMTLIGTLVPTVQYAGLINPISALEGAGRYLGTAFPATYFIALSRGVFNKALGFSQLTIFLWPIALGALVTITLAIALLKKQES